MIRCTKCGEAKDKSEFYTSCSSHCKECRRIKQRAQYASRKAETKRRRESIYKDGLKKCNTCNEYKSTEEYSPKSDNWDDLNHKCRECSNKQTQERYYADIDSTRESAKQKYKANREGILARGREWYRNNKDRKREMDRRWRKNNPEKSRALWHRYKARKMNAEGDFTDDQWKMVRDYYAPRGRCPGCGKYKPITIDHVIPLMQKGPNYISNIQPLCQPCNSSKGDERVTDYRFDGGMLAELVQEAWG